MWCLYCNNRLTDCVCPDLQERLGKVTGVNGGMVARWCMRCDQHHTACRCSEPAWGLRKEGQVTPLPTEVQDQFN